MFPRLVPLAAALTVAAMPALAQTTQTAPTTTVEREVPRDRVTVDFPDAAFMEERQISRIVQDVYGPGAEMANGHGASEAVTAALDVGRPLPPDANASPVEAKLADRLPAGATWMAVGEHLVALDATGQIRAVYHDMLP